MNIIETKHLDLYYGKNHALKDINMKIEPNKITSLIGPSGCGKSTFLRVLNRMNDIIKGVKITGQVNYRETNIYDDKVDPISIRKNIGMVFQKPNPFPLSIYDNVAFAPRYYKIKKKAVLDEIVEKSLKSAALWDEVKDRLKKPALTLSGGQQQRLCIARSVALEPEIILFDEATSALDPISTDKIEELMLKLKETYTVVAVTHNMSQALRISDMTGFFLLGDLVEYDNTKELFAVPKKEKTQEYITGRFG